MAVPIPYAPYGITDVAALQNSVAMLLLDDPRIMCPIIQELKFQMDSNIAVDALWQEPRNAFTTTPNGYTLNSGATGVVGAGLLIEMPSFTVNSPQVTGSPASWDIDIVCFEERNVNLTPNIGTAILAEQYAELCIDILQLQYIYGLGTVYVKTSAINPAHDWMSLRPGIVAERASFTATVGRQQSTRSKPCVATFSGGNCTVTCTDGAASIYYTTDDSVPCSYNVNPNNPAGVGATLYTAPFAVSSGTVVLVASRNTNLILSPVNGFTAP